MNKKSGVSLETSRKTGKTYIITENDDKPVYIHDLVAISEYGFEAVINNDVHHLNTISWDNRPSNLELVDDSSMNSFAKRGYWKMIDGEPQLHKYDGTIKELSELLDCNKL